jgi:hypothetical protein
MQDDRNDEAIDKSKRLGDLTAEDLAKPIGYGYVVSTPHLLAETLGRLRRANDGLRRVESGELSANFVELIRHEVAQAAMTVEALLGRAGDES